MVLFRHRFTITSARNCPLNLSLHEGHEYSNSHQIHYSQDRQGYAVCCPIALQDHMHPQTIYTRICHSREKHLFHFVAFCSLSSVSISIIKRWSLRCNITAVINHRTLEHDAVCQLGGKFIYPEDLLSSHVSILSTMLWRDGHILNMAVVYINPFKH